KECLQICDKKNILLNNQKFIDFFDCSKKKYKKSMESIESIRNNIAHAQNSILEGSNIEIMSDALNFCEHFLIRSDDAVLELAKN
ncbi:MAG: CBS domain-containing protein, partial [Rahnella inusitata]